MKEIYNKLVNKDAKLAVVGLGYVGLPLAVEFGKTFDTIGFDISEKKINELKNNSDSTRELTAEDLMLTHIDYTNEAARLKEASFIVVAVPTPINESKQPDLTPVIKASTTIGKNLSKNTIIVYESTVYPGVTEDECVPILEKESGLKCGIDFKVGYSPERINPGDKEHTVTKILKVVSGQDEETLDTVANVYGAIITAGIYRAESIKVAEAAKVIENTQRDLNIALMNELAIIFNKMGISTRAVLDAAGTKWNFIKMCPGLVGGHCIGVDPYYLTHKAEMLGYHPQVILSGRKINDNMGKYVAEQTVKHLIKAGKAVKDCKVMILGFTFKENVSDIRNTRVIDVINELEEYGINVFVHDPLINKDDLKHEYNIRLYDYDEIPAVDAAILAVAHDKFSYLTPEVLGQKITNGSHAKVLIDVKGFYRNHPGIKDNYIYWNL
ncbi:MAG: nucleotide sugar dehydrogenase [Candidatus Margulisiibacteriota bacterium]|nr:MAG: hypothetical protein A2X41_06650 [Candidatus Margulisbacteria bacterium GWE2_39_32]PZM82043.1 MAG: nucleotide sugar dehydrogenase [Candidatus Margulisiibacteriota bacterium]HCT84093.1 nucleotide sugar dehydrogenase [Candidatus Margulisiibacteriota bacterium]